MTERREWSSDDDKQLAITAMCIWEIIDNDPKGPWEPMRQNVGAFGMRDHCVELAVAAENLWLSMSVLAKDEAGAFDWDWIPAWLHMAVDWSGDEPVLKGSVT